MSINVLTYNTSWEASQPLLNWMIAPNAYGPPNGKSGIGYKCGRSELYEDGVLRGDDPMKNICRKNIFGIIKKGKYDLVGMQEYVHTWGGKSVYRDALNTLKNEDPPLELVMDKVYHSNFKKDIEIGLLYNKKRFTKEGNHIIGDFKVEKKNYKTNTISTGHDDGRPFLIVYLVDNNTEEKYVFINAHFPQLRGLNANLEMTKIKERVNNELTAAVQNLLAQVNHEGDYEIILTADTNDVNISFVGDLTINGKTMWIGNNIQKTCCTPVVDDIKMTEAGHSEESYGKIWETWGPDKTFTRKNMRTRKGDVILYSGNNNIKYDYPVEKPGEPYSDHAPVAVKLSPPSQYDPERRSPGCVGADCAIMGGKRRKRTRKRRRKKRTKKKARKRRRKRTRRRGGEPTYHEMPPRKKTEKKHFQLYKNPKSSQEALKMKKKAAERSGLDAEGERKKESKEYTDLRNRRTDKQEVKRAAKKRKKEDQLTRRRFDLDGLPKSPKTHHKFQKRTGGSKKLSTAQRAKSKRRKKTRKKKTRKK